MLRSLTSAVSGLKNFTLMLDVLGNNLANIRTLGYKGKPSESLIIGDTHPSGRTYYAMMSGHEEIFLVGSAYPYLIDAKLKRLIR